MLYLSYVKASNSLEEAPMQELEFLYQTWSDVQSAAEKTADQIKADGFIPDIILAVSRGGFDPARIISDQLGVKKLACLQIVYYSGLNKKNKKPRVLLPLNADVKGLNVLVVDDVSDTGNSLEVVKNYVKEKGASKVKVATLHYKPWSRFKPDYYADVVDKWILYPWEPNESIQGLVEVLMERGLTREEIPAKLREIGYTEHELNRYLRI